MMFKTHLALGILASITAINYLQIESRMLFGGVLVLASVIPDIDVSKSKVGKKIKPVSSIIGFIFGHRGVVHTIYPPLIVGLLAYLTGYSLAGSAFLIGYGTHLISDMATLQGIMPLFPLSKARAAGFMKTGGMTEYAVFFLTVIATVKLLL